MWTWIGFIAATIIFDAKRLKQWNFNYRKSADQVSNDVWLIALYKKSETVGHTRHYGVPFCWPVQKDIQIRNGTRGRIHIININVQAKAQVEGGGHQSLEVSDDHVEQCAEWDSYLSPEQPCAHRTVTKALIYIRQYNLNGGFHLWCRHKKEIEDSIEKFVQKQWYWCNLICDAIVLSLQAG